jgi:hypothetical protein
MEQNPSLEANTWTVIKQFDTLYEIWRPIAMFTRACQWFLSWSGIIHSMHSHPIVLISYLMLLYHLQLLTEQIGSSGNASDLYSRGAWFESELGYYPDWGFLFFLRPSSQMLGYYLKLGNDYFFPHSFQFISQYHPVLQHCTVWVKETADK